MSEGIMAGGNGRGDSRMPRRAAAKKKAKPNGAAGTQSIRETILAVDDIATESVPIPEWGVTVTVRTLTLAERDAFEIEVGEIDIDAANPVNVARLVAMSTFDDDGDRIFAAEDIPALSRKSTRPMMRLFNVASRLNSIGDGLVQDLAKN